MAKTKRICSVSDCNKPAATRGWCHAHYRRWRLFGDVARGGPIASHGETTRYFREVVLTYAGNECLPWPFSHSCGYGVIWQDSRQHRVTRLACEHVRGPAPTPKHHAAHSCGNGHLGCCNPHHLSWKTAAENASDKLEHDTHNRGERCPTAKLTENQVREIRSLEGVKPQREIAKQFNVNYQQISRIIRRERWTWLE